MSDYVKKMKDIADYLIASGQVIINNELINFIVDKLSSEFDPTIVLITSKLDN